MTSAEPLFRESDQGDYRHNHAGLANLRNVAESAYPPNLGCYSTACDEFVPAQ